MLKAASTLRPVKMAENFKEVHVVEKLKTVNKTTKPTR